jgi:hypothetical protein
VSNDQVIHVEHLHNVNDRTQAVTTALQRGIVRLE